MAQQPMYQRIAEDLRKRMNWERPSFPPATVR